MRRALGQSSLLHPEDYPVINSYLKYHQDMSEALSELHNLGVVPAHLLLNMEEALGGFDSIIRSISDFSEYVVANWTRGSVTGYADSYDVMSENGNRIEVKFSKLNTPNATSALRRWNWSNISGGKIIKDFDHLVLIGQSDARFEGRYKVIESRYVVFCFSRAEVDDFLKGFMSPSGRGSLAISTDTSGERAQQLMRYMVDLDELRRRFVNGDFIHTDIERAQA